MTISRGQLPPNATAFEQVESTVSERLLTTDTDIIRRARVGATTPAEFLPFLAWERSVHYWSPTDEAGNRARTDSSFGDHLSYGTPAALEAEISLDTGLDVRIVEFFEDQTLEWPDFALEAVIAPGEDTPDTSGIWRSAVFRKNVRDWPSHVRVRGLQPVATDWIGAGINSSPKVRVLPLDALPPLPTIYAGATTLAWPRIKVLPQ